MSSSPPRTPTLGSAVVASLTAEQLKALTTFPEEVQLRMRSLLGNDEGKPRIFLLFHPAHCPISGADQRPRELCRVNQESPGEFEGWRRRWQEEEATVRDRDMRPSFFS